MSVIRKTRKLVRSPGLFFYDFVDNRKRQLTSISKWIKVESSKNVAEGNYSYSVVSAVYNVEKYLDKFIVSIVNQSLDFKKNIELILVDDGSSDGSERIIRKWQARFPDNIVYVRKDNGGQASARNLGLRYVTREWVTFIDPDDFVSKDYFIGVDEFISKHSGNPVQLVSCKFLQYFEDTGKIVDNHPLAYRFEGGDLVFKVGDLKDHVQLSVNSAFFRYRIIKSERLTFDERIKPSFEDAHFVSRYMLSLKSGVAGFASRPKYYYRKRSDGSSTLNTSWEKPSLFYDVLKYGCLDVLEKSLNDNGQVPEYLQRTVLYHLIWYYKRIVDNPQSVSFLTEEERQRFKDILCELFEYIDVSTIMRFNLGGAWFFHKVGFIGLYKGREPDFQIVYVDGYDRFKSQIKLRYFFYKNDHEEILLDEKDVIPDHAKTVVHEFLGDVFVSERVIWAPVKGDWQTLKVKIGGKDARVSFLGKHYLGGLCVGVIAKAYREDKHGRGGVDLSAKFLLRFAGMEIIRRKFHGAWLLMDRDCQADDNAEHLYRYIKENHPEVNAYFVLRRSSHDWPRLKREGFKLLAFGSPLHKVALLNCRHLVSSHADAYVTNYLPEKSYGVPGFHFTFLQHGVTHNDLSKWLNTKSISKFITTTPDEWGSISSSGSRYKFTSKEVVLTGMPRHDALLDSCGVCEKLIVIMPTWRDSIIGPGSRHGATRKLSGDFIVSDYAINWGLFLKSQDLREICRQYDYKVVFFPHVNIQPYLSLMELPEHILVLDHGGASIQDLFRRAAVMITDYSSVAFEFALLEKPVVYFQFDRDEVFGGGHTTAKGYFDYDRDGFGPVAEDVDGVLQALKKVIKNGANVDRQYLERIRRAFPFRDGRCCSRVFDEICDIERPGKEEGMINIDLLSEYVSTAIEYEDWRLAENRMERLIGLNEESRQPDHVLRLAIIKRNLGKIDDAYRLLSEVASNLIFSEVFSEEKDKVDECKAYLDLSPDCRNAVEGLVLDGYVFKELDLDFVEALYEHGYWKAAMIACSRLSRREDVNLNRLYYIWAMAAREIGLEELEVPVDRDLMMPERRSASRPWFRVAEASSGSMDACSELAERHY